MPRFIRQLQREIYKEGKRIKLQEQPCQVLALLIERPGELVSREELRKRLWTNDTFVDFDHGVNIAINSEKTNSSIPDRRKLTDPKAHILRTSA